MKIRYDQFRLKKVTLKNDYSRFYVEWTEQHEADEYGSDRTEKASRESTYSCNAKLFSLFNEILPFVVDLTDSDVKLSSIEVADFVDSFEKVRFVYETYNGGDKPDRTKTSWIDLLRDNEWTNKIISLLNKVKGNCFEFCIKGVKFRPYVTEAKIDTETGEIML